MPESSLEVGVAEPSAANGIDWGLSADVVSALEQVHYSIGFADGQKDMLDRMAAHMRSIKAREFEEMKLAAETFYRELVKMMPEGDVIEHRIGYDSGTEEPATLTVVSRRSEAMMPDILGLAAECELGMYKKYGYCCYFWVITDEQLDRPLIEHDFPYIREGLSGANA